MGKKRVVRKTGSSFNRDLKSRSLSRTAKKKFDTGVVHILATFNNTKMVLTDIAGNTAAWSTSGALGFSGAKKGTPFAAAKVGELLGEKAALIGVTSVDVVVNGIGPGRESAIRSFAGKGIAINKITDRTAVPFNGPRKPRPRRV
jgi:small subunit ribosomal protein S11